MICCRIISLRKALDDLLDEANKIIYYCPACLRTFTIEEAIPDFVCNICPNSQLVKKESSVAEAKAKRQQGIREIKHMESLMRECLDVTLPSSFFGAITDTTEKPTNKSQNANSRISRPAAGSRGFIINVNLPEIEFESKETVDLNLSHDLDLFKYYQKLASKSKRKKVNDEGTSENKSLGTDKQNLMSDQEFNLYFEWKTKNFLFL